MRTIQVQLQGRTYAWNGSRWTDARFLQPPSRVRGQLMAELVRTVERTPFAELDLDLALRAAAASAQEGLLVDAHRLAERLRRDNPEDARAAAVLGSVLRRQRQPRRALRVTRPFARCQDADLLTVRAAAFCDVSDWPAADRTIRRAVAARKSEITDETARVLARVMARMARSAA